MTNRRKFLATAASVPLGLLAGCAALGGNDTETTPESSTTTSESTTTATPSSPAVTDIPSGPAEQPLRTAVAALEQAYTALEDVGLVKNEQVYFDPETVISFQSSAVTNHTDTARSALENARKAASEDLAIITHLESVATIFEDEAKAIPKSDDVLSSYNPYLEAVENWNWVEAMNTAESAVLSGRDGYSALSEAGDVIATLPRITVIDGFQTSTHAARLEILQDAYLALATTYMGIYHVAYGTSWYQAAFLVHNQGKNESAAEGMQKAVDAYKYSIQLLRKAADNEQLTYGQQVERHFCAADNIGVAALRYKNAFLKLAAGETAQAQSLADDARSILKKAECELAYDDYALQWADQKGDF